MNFRKNKNKSINYLFIILIFVLFINLFFFTGCKFKENSKIIKDKRILFDSFFEIAVISSNPENTREDISELFTLIEGIGNKFDWRNKESLFSSFDKNSDFIVPDDLQEFFQIIYFYYKYTDGYFNPFLRKLVSAYNSFSEGTIPPDDQKLSFILNEIKDSKFILDKDNKKIISVSAPQNLDLGAAIAGFLVDFSYNFLLEKGYKNFLVNGSGEIRVSGKKNGKSWLIGIQSPFDNSIIDMVKLSDGYSISTSGSYERYFVYNKEKYHHILNPYTGKPDSKLESVSIISKESCLSTDILSTAIFAMGISKAIKFCEDKKLIYYIIYKEGEKIEIKKSRLFEDFKY